MRSSGQWPDFLKWRLTFSGRFVSFLEQNEYFIWLVSNKIITYPSDNRACTNIQGMGICTVLLYVLGDTLALERRKNG
jgi:hypothetical protein